MKVEITWNNVKNGLPRKKGNYLISVKGGVITASYNPKSKKFTGADLYEFGNVDAWAELPKPFTEENVNNQ